MRTAMEWDEDAQRRGEDGGALPEVPRAMERHTRVHSIHPQTPNTL